MLWSLASSQEAWDKFLPLGAEFCFTAADLQRQRVILQSPQLMLNLLARVFRQAKERGSPEALALRGALGSQDADGLLVILSEIVEDVSAAALPGMPPGGDAHTSYFIAPRPLDHSGTEEELLERETSSQDLRSIGRSHVLVERLELLRRCAEENTDTSARMLRQQLASLETDDVARPLLRIINYAGDEVSKASTGEFNAVECNVRVVRMLLDRRLVAAVCSRKPGAVPEDVPDGVRQQLRFVRIGNIGRVKLTCLVGHSGEGWKKQSPFKPFEALGSNALPTLLKALALLSQAWLLTRPMHSLDISAFCTQLGSFICDARETGSSWAALGTYYSSFMRRVDGGFGDLQRGEGLIARPVPPPPGSMVSRSRMSTCSCVRLSQMGAQQITRRS